MPCWMMCPAVISQYFCEVAVCKEHKMLTATANDGATKYGTSTAQNKKNAVNRVRMKGVSRKTLQSQNFRPSRFLSASFGLMMRRQMPKVTKTMNPITRVAQPKPTDVSKPRKTAE